MIVVAGHVCLDIFPGLESSSEWTPGRLIEVGPALLSTGGAVANVGMALHRLGADVRLVGRVGADGFGSLVRSSLVAAGPLLGEAPSEATSYSIVLSRPGEDRIFLHFPGVNATFGAEHVPWGRLSGARWFHFGYPPLMRRTFLEGGAELERILASARAHGCAVSLDMSLPDQDSESGRADWRSILSRVLPLVDVFFPSEAEARFMLRSSSPVEELAGECVGMGAKAVVMKLGADGLLGLDSAGFVRQGCFRAEVVGTTGSGDATIAGFLYGRAQGWSFAECLRAGCAVGACSVEQADATSGIPSWGEIEARMSMGWGMLD